VVGHGHGRKSRKTERWKRMRWGKGLIRECLARTCISTLLHPLANPGVRRPYGRALRAHLEHLSRPCSSRYRPPVSGNILRSTDFSCTTFRRWSWDPAMPLFRLSFVMPSEVLHGDTNIRTMSGVAWRCRYYDHSTTTSRSTVVYIFTEAMRGCNSYYVFSPEPWSDNKLAKS
jgi:hypothetical protein